jgi:hypothetical protein
MTAGPNGFMSFFELCLTTSTRVTPFSPRCG